MEIKKQINKVKELVKGKEIPIELYNKIDQGWKKLPLYRKLPTTRNLIRFVNDLKLNNEEKNIVIELKIFNK